MMIVRSHSQRRPVEDSGMAWCARDLYAQLLFFCFPSSAYFFILLPHPHSLFLYIISDFFSALSLLFASWFLTACWSVWLANIRCDIQREEGKNVGERETHFRRHTSGERKQLGVELFGQG